MPKILSLPKWAQEIIQQLQRERNRLLRDVQRFQEKSSRQSDEIQTLLDIVRILRPDLYDRWNQGVPLVDLRDEAAVRRSGSV